MIDPASEAYAAWSRAQRDLATRCGRLSRAIAGWQKRRAEVISGEAQERDRLARMEKRDLLANVTDRGPRIWSSVVVLDKSALIDWLILDRLARIDREIGQLSRELADSQPSPMWQREEQS